MSHPDKELVDQVAKGIAPKMLDGATVANLIYAAIAFGHAAALRGWSLEQTIEEGKKL